MLLNGLLKFQKKPGFTSLLIWLLDTASETGIQVILTRFIGLTGKFVLLVKQLDDLETLLQTATPNQWIPLGSHWILNGRVSSSFLRWEKIQSIFRFYVFKLLRGSTSHFPIFFVSFLIKYKFHLYLISLISLELRNTLNTTHDTKWNVRVCVQFQLPIQPPHEIVASESSSPNRQPIQLEPIQKQRQEATNRWRKNTPWGNQQQNWKNMGSDSFLFHMGVSKIGIPQNGWFIMENPMSKWMVWGYPYFWKHPYLPCDFFRTLGLSNANTHHPRPKSLQYHMVSITLGKWTN